MIQFYDLTKFWVFKGDSPKRPIYQYVSLKRRLEVPAYAEYGYVIFCASTKIKLKVEINGNIE